MNKCRLPPVPWDAHEKVTMEKVEKVTMAVRKSEGGNRVQCELAFSHPLSTYAMVCQLI